MNHSLTRRKLFSALTAGSAVVIAGCESDESEPPGVDDTQSEDEEGDEPDAREPQVVLFVASDEEYTLGESEQYDAVEIEPEGAVLFEPNSSLELTDLMNV